MCPITAPVGGSFLAYWGSSTCHCTSVLLFVCVEMSLSQNTTHRSSAILATEVAFISLHTLHKMFNSKDNKVSCTLAIIWLNLCVNFICGGRNFSIHTGKCWQDRPFSERKMFAFCNLTVKMALLTRSRMNLMY